MEAGEQSNWVVGQDKGNALLYRAEAGFGPAPHDFSTPQSAVRASLHRAYRRSPYRACLQKLWYRAKPLPLFVLMMLAAGTVLMGVAGELFQLRITLTDSSAPVGVYREVEIPAGRGALVAACLPAAIARQGLVRGVIDTKGGRVCDYGGISPGLLPYLRYRPMSRHRDPNGISRAGFFQKDVTRRAPPPWPARGCSRRIPTPPTKRL